MIVVLGGLADVERDLICARRGKAGAGRRRAASTWDVGSISLLFQIAVSQAT